MVTKKYNWLDKHIKEQKHNRNTIGNVWGTQERAERENWDAPKKPISQAKERRNRREWNKRYM